jgi:C4-dicarboxylate transporter DctM subunit
VVIFLMILMFVLMGTPMAVAFAMLIPGGVYYWLHGVPLSVLPQKMASAAQSFPLLAIPFFVLAGELMNRGGITDRLVRFANVLVGHLIGGLGHVVVMTNVIMAGISGSAAADAAGTGSVLVPAMVKRGYTPAFAAAIVAAAATIGPIIPPSIPMVIYGALAEVSTSRLLIGGVIPGLLMGVYLMVANYLVAKKRRYPREDRATGKDVLKATVKALPALGLPFIIVGGIVLGAFTPTEAAAVAVVYALVLAGLIYRELTWRDLWEVARRTSAMVAAIMFLIGATNIVGDLVTRERIDESISSFFLSFTENPLLILLMVNIMLLILGIPLEPIPLMLIFIPMLAPFMAKIGVDPIHFGVVMVLNLMLGLITPPVGMVMFVMMSMAKCSMWEFTKEILPFFIALLAVLVLITYVPSVVLWLPDLLLGARRV